MTTKETAIKFALWLREVDTQERAEEWFGYTDEDMYDCFLNFFPTDSTPQFNPPNKDGQYKRNECFDM